MAWLPDSSGWTGRLLRPPLPCSAPSLASAVPNSQSVPLGRLPNCPDVHSDPLTNIRMFAQVIELLLLVTLRLFCWASPSAVLLSTTVLNSMKFPVFDDLKTPPPVANEWLNAMVTESSCR